MKYILIISLISLSIIEGAGSHSGGHHGEEAHWDAPKYEANKKNPTHKSKDSINKGAILFKNNCASCHGVKADGKGIVGKNFKIKPTDLVSMSGKHKDGDFFWKINTGKGDMPSWKNLGDDKVWDLVNFIQSLADNDGHGDGHHGDGHH